MTRFLDPKGFQIVAVGSCANVVQCVEALADSKIVRGGEAVGIVDRDFWFPSHLASLEAKKIFALTVHEVESLYVLKESFLAVAARVGANDADLHSTLMASLRGKASSFVVRVATERAKQRLFSELSRHIDKIPSARLLTRAQAWYL